MAIFQFWHFYALLICYIIFVVRAFRALTIVLFISLLYRYFYEIVVLGGDKGIIKNE